MTHIVSFLSERFHPCLTASTMIGIFYEHYIHRKSFVKTLKAHLPLSSLGSHADIILFSLKQVTVFRWGNNTSRPFGEHPPTICPQCHSILPWTSSFVKETRVGIKCKECRFALVFELPLNVQKVPAVEVNKWYEHELL